MLRRLLNGPVGAVIGWLPILVMTLMFGVEGQWLLFGGDATSWQFLKRWPILWIAYFFLGHVAGEYLSGRLARKMNL